MPTRNKNVFSTADLLDSIGVLIVAAVFAIGLGVVIEELGLTWLFVLLVIGVTTTWAIFRTSRLLVNLWCSRKKRDG